jgi:type II secretory ATPase GspE/PulE/Tfp pilus assembly ATPase PilB-like protein
MTPPLKFRDPLVSRIKIMARLDIAEKAAAAGRPHQSAVQRSRHQPRDRLPCVGAADLFGEKIVLRLLDAKACGST